MKLPGLSSKSITEQVIAGLVVGLVLIVAAALVGTMLSRPSESPPIGAGATPSASHSLQPASIGGGSALASLPISVTPVSISPTESAESPAPSLPTAPTTSAAPPGGIVYQTDWSGGLGGWSGSSDWSVSDGHAFSAGTPSWGAGQEPGFAPLYILPVGDIIVEARIRLIRLNSTIGPFETFGLSIRASEAGSDAFGVCTDCLGGSIVGLSTAGFENPLGARPFTPGADWHDYRAEYRGAHIVGYVDGNEVLDVIETTNTNGDIAGLWSSGSVIEVATFVISQP